MMRTFSLAPLNREPWLRPLTQAGRPRRDGARTSGVLKISRRALTFAAPLFLGLSQALGQLPIFSKITNGPVVTDGGMSWCCTWGDYDGDGFPDLFVTNGDFSAGKRNFLYHNNGNGTFTRITTGSIVSDTAQFRGCAWVDIDNDGHPDLSVVSHGTGNFLYHNNGNGTFTRVVTNVIAQDAIVNSIAGSWGDYNRDGYVDFFVSNSGGVPNYLYKNNGANVFEKVLTGSIASDVGNGEGATWVDYNGDGQIDLFVCNFLGPVEFLYLNSGESTFRRVTDSAVGPIITDAADSSNCAWGDYDNDGYPDLFVANTDGETCSLYHNQGDGTFMTVTGTVLTASTGFWRGCAWGDFDNDGYLDLFVANSHLNCLYHNNGDGTFEAITNTVITSEGASYGCSWVDYDRNGFLDLFVANGAAITPVEADNYLYHNEGNTNAWININCVGTVSNRSAIGTKVRLKATIHSKTFWQVREVSMGDGFGSGNPLELHFGLGDATDIDEMLVEWPSGIRQTLTHVAVRQNLTITEPPRLFATVGDSTPQFFLKGGRGFQYQIEASPDLLNWTPLGPLTITNTDGTAQIADAYQLGAPIRFYRAVSN